MPTKRVLAWGMWIIASIFYAYQYILRVMPNIMINDIMSQFHIDAATFGQFSGIYYIGYSLLHLPIGILLDRFGPRRVMSGCILLTVIGLLPILFAEYWIYPIIGRLLIGIGSSAAILGTFKIIRMTFSEKKFTRMLSFSVMIGLLGAIYGGGPVNYMCNALGYKAVVATFAGLGIVLAFITFCIIPDMRANETLHIRHHIKEVLLNKRVLFVCLMAGLMVGPLEGFADVWGTAFIQNVYKFDSTVSSSLPSMIFIGMCFGAPVLSFIAEKTNAYFATIIGAGLVMATSFFLLITGLLSSSMIALLFILVGIASSYQILAIYKASTFVSEESVGLTTAVANMIIMIFGYGFHTTIGLIVDLIGKHNEKIAYTYGIMVVPIALTVGVIGFSILAIKERLVQKA